MFLWLAAGGSTRAAPDPAAAWREAMNRRDHAAAAAIVDQELAARPADADWRLARAELAAAAGRLGEALGQVIDLRRAEPRHRRSRLKEGQWLSQLGRFRAATAAYESCLQDFPEDPDALTGLGLIQLWSGALSEAGALFDRALRRTPDHEVARLARLRLWIAAGQPGQAWAEGQRLDQATGRTDPELGLLLAGLLLPVQAGEDARRLASRPGADAGLRLRQLAFLARLEALAGHLVTARQQALALASVEPPDYDASIEAANVCAAADDRAAARVHYERALRLTPERPEALLGLARLVSREGRLSGSLALYRRVVAANPESMEGWLGVLRTTVLQEDAPGAREALTAAATQAPTSVFLHHQALRLALLEGDLDAFDRRLAQLEQQQPLDVTARLWRLRRQAAAGSPPAPEALTPLLDGLAPETTAAGLRWLAPSPSLPAELLNRAPPPELASLEPWIRGALARALACQLRPAQAQRVSPHSSVVKAVGQGWWAYASTPWAYGTDLQKHFDAQAVSVWLVAATERRLRTLAVETESPLWEEWLLLRAAWFARWRDRWASPAAAADLRQSLTVLGEGWSQPIGLPQVEAAWRDSEASLPGAEETYEVLLARARWRLYRHDHGAALLLFRRLERDYPGATEPIQRQAEVLRAAGRFSEAARILHRLCLEPDASPGVRLEQADLLRRLGRLDEARRELERLRTEGLDEPELAAALARLAESEGRADAVRTWYRTGLERHPRSAALLAGHAAWLERNHDLQALAALISAVGLAPGLQPDHVAAAAPFLPPDTVARLRGTSSWWFGWQWLGWERLTGRSVSGLRFRAEDGAEHAALEEAIATLQPALDARLPDAELWLQGARWLDLDDRGSEAARAWEAAAWLGCGRIDAEVLRLVQEAVRRPGEVAREFQRRLEIDPDQRPVRVGLVHALLRLGALDAATQALAPLREEDPLDREVQVLAAQVSAAAGRLRQARSVYASLLRDDPLAADPRAAQRALRQHHEIGGAAGLEHQFRQDTSGTGAALDDWQEGFLSIFWRPAAPRTVSLEYHFYERSGDLDHQVWAQVAQGIGRDWVVRAQAGVGPDADYTARGRAELGFNRRVTETLFLGLDTRYLGFEDLGVWQLVPGVTWRWHPRGTAEGRLYVAHNRLETGASNESFTGLVRASWQLGAQSLLAAHAAYGDENNVNPTTDLLGNDSFLGAGLEWRLGGRHRWTLTPAYRYERHADFDLHALSLSAGVAF